MMKMTKQEFLTSSGLKVRTLELWIEQKWIIPEESDSGSQFSAIDVARAQFILDLQSDLGANDAGIDVILHLSDQLHGLRRALAQLREDMRPAED